MEQYLIPYYLFYIYINDIINSSGVAKFVLFADDTNILITVETEAEAYSMANTALSNVRKYIISFTLT